MKSYIIVTFNSEGAKPSEVANKLAMLGFKPAKGNYDFFYEWSKQPTLEDAIVLADKVHEMLRGTKVIFKMETI